jgi:hypothetical protein
MGMLKMNLRQEHWETLSYTSNCIQLLTPWQMATLVVESQPQWCAAPLLPAEGFSLSPQDFHDRWPCWSWSRSRSGAQLPGSLLLQK